MSDQNAHEANGNAGQDALQSAMEVYGCDAETTLEVVSSNIGGTALREAMDVNEPKTTEIEAVDKYGVDRGD